MVKVVIGIILFLLNAYFLDCMKSKLHRGSIFNLNVIDLSFLPKQLIYILSFLIIAIVIILMYFAYSFILIFGFLLYDYIIIGDVKNIFSIIIILLLADIFVSTIFEEKK